jgi:DMSO/TMAO reductase YedYZ heme-binding membrane subunit/nitrite reductase/ring-hydroxylating ferredoxin subunit
MSAGYKPISWNRAKIVYDLAAGSMIAGYLAAFTLIGPLVSNSARHTDPHSLWIKALGSCAFILLTIILAIGPLARLDVRFLPVLYNRRHLGVATAVIALMHAWQVVDWYFSAGSLPPVVALLASAAPLHPLPAFPFIPLGIVALAILLVMAATSHDFWLAFLSPPVWKGLHMAVYGAYGLAVLHIAFGGAQAQSSGALMLLCAGSVVALAGLHLAAGSRARQLDARRAAEDRETNWIVAAEDAFSIIDGRAIVVRPPGSEPIAIFRDGQRLSATTNLCAHQNGPLGEGRIVDGCITCPWHAYQYRMEDGCAPPPFTERIPTYRLRLAGKKLLLDPRPNPPGTFVEPALLRAREP